VTLGIVVPNLNQGRFLADALDSVLAYAAPALHVALMDGGSEDGSVEVIDRYRSRLAVCRSGRDRGHVAAVNEGVRQLTARHPDIEAVGFLNADDYLVGRGVWALAEALAAHPSWAVAAGRGFIVDEQGRQLGEYPVGPFTRAALSHRCTVCQPAALVRRTSWERAGGIDERFEMSGDYDLWWRLLRFGEIGYVDEVVAASRDHGGTKTRNGRRQYFRESIGIVRRETGWTPWHWCISEALERQAGWRMDSDPGLKAKSVAGARAAASYVLRNVLGRNT
jgi:GT2 family glycosyltransferase